MTPQVVHVASGREWRGGQRQVWLLARELQRDLGRHGWTQAVVTGAGTELARRLETDRVTVCPARWHLALDPRALAAIRRQLRRQLQRGPAVLHAHDSHALALADVARVGSTASLIATRRTTFPLRRYGFWRRAERVIAISAAVRETLIAGGILPERITVIASAASSEDLRRVPAAPLGIRARLGLPQDVAIAVTVAALSPEKGHETLVDAAAELISRRPCLHWVMAGEGPCRPALEARIRTRGVATHVHLLGEVADIPGLLSEATLFVLPSTSEGLGTAVLEAMARGVPVVATAAGGLAESLGGGAGLVLPAADPSETARAVERVIGDADLRRKLAAAGRRRATAHEPRGMAERTMHVYRSCSHCFDGT